MKDGAHTHHDHTPGGLGLAVSIAAGLVLADVIRALLPVLLIGLSVTAGLVMLGLVARVLAKSSCQHHFPLARRTGSWPLQAADDDPIQVVTNGITRTRPPELHQHLHFHGLDPAQVAAILAAEHDQAINREGDAW